MDAFQRIAYTFKKDCEHKLQTLEMVQSIVASSNTIAEALHTIFFKQTEIYPGDYEQIRTMSFEINRLRNCIDHTEETIEHARKLYIINFSTAADKFLVFNQEICYSYTCKMLNSMGPRLQHFSNSPTHSEIVDAELSLALGSPYTFNDSHEDLFCYESMP